MRHHLKKDKRGISNIIVVVLSLIIIVVIVANVILWSYQMNQLDWERIQENVSIENVATVPFAYSYNPSGYTLGGSTSWLSGGISNLISDNDVYMIFRSYYSGTDTTDFVDNICDLYSPPAKGTHSNFAAQQAGPDSIYDRLTEANTGSISNTTLINSESFEGVWPPSGWTESGYWSKSSSQAYSGTYSAMFDSPSSGSSGDLTTIDLNCLDASAIYVDFWYRDEGCESSEFRLQYYDGFSWDTISDLGATTSEGQWLYYQQKITDNQYFKSNYKIRWRAQTNYYNDDAYVDLVAVKKEVDNTNYELDLEIQWTNADYSQTNEYLCIYGGTMDTENIRVDVWSDSAWQNLFTDLANGWNNVTVSSYLTSSTFTIRFNGGTESGDTVQDSWYIDVTLLHVWTDGYTLEVEFTGSSSTEDWNQLTWTVDSAWTVASVSVTLQLYNYTLGAYPTSGNGYISYTSSATPNTDETKNQTIAVNPTHFRNVSGNWKMKVKGVTATSSQFDLKVDWIEFKPTINGAGFTFKNKGALTSHIVSLWIINSTYHQRYSVDIFLNSGKTLPYSRMDIHLPSGQYMVKIVTDRGNAAIYSED
jgi:hypothetical protein